MAVKAAVPSITPADLDPVELFTFLWSQVMLLQVWKLWIRVRAQIISKSLLDISLGVLVSAAGEDASTWAMMLLLLSACVAGILFSQSGRATVFLGITSLLVLCWTGSQSNHVIMKMIMSLAVLCSYSTRRRTWGLQACHAARSFLIALYCVTALDKMNSDWFDTRYSCATLMHLGVIATPPFQWMLHAASLELIPPAAAFTEVALPVLLLLGICDRLTAVLGCIFHLLICQMLPPMSVYPFSMLMAPIYVFIIPDQSCMLFNSLRTWRWAAAIGLLVTVLHANWEAFMVGPSTHGESSTTTLFEYPPYGLWSTGVIWCWIVNVALVVAAALLPSTQSAGKDDEADDGMATSPSSLSRSSGCLVSVIVVLLGMCPYLGVRNYPALAMFSNLRTEGGRGNHIFLADDFDLLGWQRDYVIIHETNIRHLVNAQVDLAPLFTARTTRVLQEAGVAREFWITPPPGAWPYAETRPFVPYAVPRLEVQRRIAPIAVARQAAGAGSPQIGRRIPNMTSTSTGDEEVSYPYVRYTRVLAQPRLAWPWLWKTLGLDLPAEEDQVLRTNMTYRLGVDEDVDDLAKPLPLWQSALARFRTFDLETSPCRH